MDGVLARLLDIWSFVILGFGVTTMGMDRFKQASKCRYRRNGKAFHPRIQVVKYDRRGSVANRKHFFETSVCTKPPQLSHDTTFLAHCFRHCAAGTARGVLLA